MSDTTGAAELPDAGDQKKAMAAGKEINKHTKANFFMPETPINEEVVMPVLQPQFVKSTVEAETLS